MKRITVITVLTSIFYLSSCDWKEDQPRPEELTLFTKVAAITLVGGETAAEISAYDPGTKKLFVINAVKRAIDVVNLEDPFNLVYESELSIIPYGIGVNSVAVKNGLLAAAVESDPKTAPGKVVIWNASDLSEKAVVTVGSLPDMVAFSHNGKFLISANEGEPNEDYTVDPMGSVSIISVPSFSVVTLDFAAFSDQINSLRTKGFRTFGPTGTTLAQDIEPEYVAISHDSRTAWVTLQENNAVAKLDLINKKIEKIFPLGFKDHNSLANILDPSDRNSGVVFGSWPVKGMYLPDAISAFYVGGMQLLITANEGDSRLRPTDDDTSPPLEEGELFNEEERIKDVLLDPAAFPDATSLQADDKLGRLKITNTWGDTDGDGDYDELFSFGTRSFTIRRADNGQIVYESGSKLEQFILQERPSLYDDGRSDDKGVEPESVTTGKIGNRTVAFVGLERADAVVVVDVTNPSFPRFLQVLETGDAPEGILFIPAHESPNGKSLLVTSCEGDGSVQVFMLSSEENI